MNILLTGGAGFVGSVCAEQLVEQHHRVIVLDNLATGHLHAVPQDVIFVRGDLGDSGLVRELVRAYAVEATMHFAGETLVTNSMTDPRIYFDNNVRRATVLLDTLLGLGVRDFIFSSTAAVYGDPLFSPITESHPTQPINAYGESKLMFEKILAWYHRAYGVRQISLRYFNAAGASQHAGEDHRPETHLIPLLLASALESNRPCQIYGSDYPTPDGTCIRDYVHVLDMAQAHIQALDGLQQGRSGAYNIGSGTGYSVREVLRAVEQVTGRKLRAEIGPRRPGDPAVLVASHERLVSELGWRPRYSDLHQIVSSAWEWTLAKRKTCVAEHTTPAA